MRVGDKLHSDGAAVKIEIVVDDRETLTLCLDQKDKA